jgi:phage baseplate assembly protein W
MALGPVTTTTLVVAGAVTPGASYLSPYSTDAVFTPPAVPEPVTIAALEPLAGRVPHLAWPLTIIDGVLATVEQDTIEDVRQCVEVLLRTPAGARPLAPAIGLADPTFTGGFDAPLVTAQLEEWEPRAALEITTAGPDGPGQEAPAVRVRLAAEEA